MTKVAIIGSGVAGLSAALRTSKFAHVTLFEAESRLGGHANTVDVTLEGVTHGVDTGFLVYNERTYPGLIRLFAELGVVTAPSDMSFSVQVPDKDMEWCGTNLNSVFAQRRNLLRADFWTMLREILRFNELATSLAVGGSDAELQEPVGSFLYRNHFSDSFRDLYFLPMIGCIWSCPTEQMLKFPVSTLIRFCHNHGLLQVVDRPQWYTVAGGSRQYVSKLRDKLLAQGVAIRSGVPVQQVFRNPRGVQVLTDTGPESFDEVVFACHSDQALSLLAQPTLEEQDLLGAIRYHGNTAVLHTDTAVLPKRKLAWAAWNYERASNDSREQAQVCLHYLLNRLQPLPFKTPVIVTLNPARAIDESKVIRKIDYAHPVFDQAAVAAQPRIQAIQGDNHTWFAGAWLGYGFHEDGYQSAQKVAQGMHAVLSAASSLARVALGGKETVVS